jgi:hypothetical protein
MHHEQLNRRKIKEDRFNHKHDIKFQDTWILSNVTDYMERLIREAVEGGWPDFERFTETPTSPS